MIIHTKTSKNTRNFNDVDFKAPAAGLSRIYLFHKNLNDSGVNNLPATAVGIDNIKFNENRCYPCGTLISAPLSNDILYSSDKTYALWINASYCKNKKQTIFYFGYPSTNSYMHLYINDEILVLDCGGKTSSVDFSFNFGKDTLIQIVYSNKHVLFRIDNDVLEFDLTLPLNISKSFMYFANMKDTSQPLYGSIFNIRLYSRALKVKEQLELLKEFQDKPIYFIDINPYLNLDFQNHDIVNSASGSVEIFQTSGAYGIDNILNVESSDDYLSLSDFNFDTSESTIAFSTSNKLGLILSSNIIQISATTNGISYSSNYNTETSGSVSLIQDITDKQLNVVLKQCKNYIEVWLNNFKQSLMTSINTGFSSLVFGNSQRTYNKIRIYDSWLNADKTFAFNYEENNGYKYILRKEGFDIWGFPIEKNNLFDEIKYEQGLLGYDNDDSSSLSSLGNCRNKSFTYGPIIVNNVKYTSDYMSAVSRPDKTSYYTNKIIGFIYLAKLGTYTFYISNCDDQVLLAVNNNQLCYASSAGSTSSGSFKCEKEGYYIFELYTMNISGPGYYGVKWKKPGDENYIDIPDNVFFHEN